MKRAVPIIVILVIGMLSYFAYTVVNDAKNTQVRNENDALKKQVADLTKSVRARDESHAKHISQIHDTLVIALPQSKEIIENVFNPSTKPATTAPAATQPVVALVEPKPVTTQPSTHPASHGGPVKLSK